MQRAHLRVVQNLEDDSALVHEQHTDQAKELAYIDQKVFEWTSKRVDDDRHDDHEGPEVPALLYRGDEVREVWVIFSTSVLPH